jgi:AcrR family transcriptional regulator
MSVPRAYHHGDVPRAALHEARALLDASGLDAVTLTEIARRVGVTHAAMYRHFSNRHALLEALAGVCFEDLRAAMLAEADVAPTARSAFLSAGWSVVRYARTWPHRYRLLFAGPLDDSVEALRSAPPESAFGALIGLIERWQRSGLFRRGDPTTIALVLWSTTHGLASLLVPGRLDAGDEDDVRALVDRVHLGILEGLRPRGRAHKKARRS